MNKRSRSQLSSQSSSQSSSQLSSESPHNESNKKRKTEGSFIKKWMNDKSLKV
jgi:hypothetical protein